MASIVDDHYATTQPDTCHFLLLRSSRNRAMSSNAAHTMIASASRSDAAPVAESQVGSRCEAQHERGMRCDATRRQLRGAEGHLVWSYLMDLPCCRQACEIRGDTRYLTYTVVSGGRALHAVDEESAFQELRALTERRAAAEGAMEAQRRRQPTLRSAWSVESSTTEALAGSSSETASERSAAPLAFRTAPSSDLLSALRSRPGPSYHYAPSSSGRSRSMSSSGSSRTLLGGRFSARSGSSIRGLDGYSASALATPDRTTRAQLKALYADERSARAKIGERSLGNALMQRKGFQGSLKVGHAFGAREGVGIGGTDGRGGGTASRMAPPALLPAPSPSSHRTASNTVGNEGASSRLLEEIGKVPTRRKVKEELGRNEGARRLVDRLASKHRRDFDPFQAEMDESVESGRRLRSRVS